MKLQFGIVFLAAATAPMATKARNANYSSMTSVPSRAEWKTQQQPQKRAAFNIDSVAKATGGNVSQVRGGDVGGGTATMTNEMFNMVKAVVGVGVLSLPAGE
mmetsp:Transcript_23804/g.49858  ORF Transcript_23804/g.49858 Transcript_23804/m.49858 type:complete len:102 (-) Transcript_23804:75-380(-)